MKCPNCHAEIDSNVCPYCGLDIEKQQRDYNRFESFIYGVLRFERGKNKLAVVLFVVIALASFVPILTLPAVTFGAVIMTVVHALVKIIALGFVGWIALSLLSGWKHYKTISDGGVVTEGAIVDSKNMKEIHIGGKGCVPIVEFPAGGCVYRVVGSKSSERKFAKGEPKEVVYLPEDPCSAFLAEEGSHTASLVLGVFLLAIVILFAVFA